MASHGPRSGVVSTGREDEVAECIGLLTAGSRIRLRLADDDRLVALVRRGDTAAFEALYERHCASLLSFCIYMLGSRHDAEDVIQATFTSAYRALRADGRPVALRAWLFTIARNECLNSLRRRRPTVELNGEKALAGDPWRELEIKEELRVMLEGLRELPERQRAALLLTEAHGLSQAEIAAVLGVRTEQVKAYVHQARANLAADRTAREDDCREIREELARARGAALLRGRLRRHVRSCSDCRLYADGVARRRRQLSAVLPLGPALMLRYRMIEDALWSGAGDPATYSAGAAAGGSAAGLAAGLAGGGLQALVAKVAAGIVVLGLGAGVGASVLNSSGVSGSQSPPAPGVAHQALLASAWTGGAAGAATTSPGGVLIAPRAAAGVHAGTAIRSSTAGGLPTVQDAGPQPAAGGPVVPAPERAAQGPVVSARARASEEERRRSREERAVKREEARQLLIEQREQAREEHQQAHEGHQQSSNEREQAQEERQHAQEERQHTREERRHTQQERKPHEEQGPKRTSGVPKTEAERLRLREERKAKRIARSEARRARSEDAS